MKTRTRSMAGIRHGVLMAGCLAFLLATNVVMPLLWAAPAAAASILSSPAGAVIWNAGSTQTIEWNAQNSGDNYVTLYFSADSGSTWSQITQGVPASQAQYSWTVPSATTTHARIMITVWTRLAPKGSAAPAQVVLGSDQSADFTISQAGQPSPNAVTPAPTPTSPQTSGITVLVNGQPLTGDSHPFIEGGRVMVPFRAIFEALGATVDWDAGLQTVTGTQGDTTVGLIIGKNTAYINSAPVSLDEPATIVGGMAFVPARFVAEALGAGVSWDESSNTVSITFPANSSSGPAPTGYITIQDSTGREVTVPVAPKRIVVCNSYAADAICALGAAGSIVGAPSGLISIPLLNQEIVKAQNVGTMSSPDSSLIISLKPDIEFGPITQPQSFTDTLEQNGITVVLLDCSRIDTMDSDLGVLGSILGQEQRTAELTGFIDKYRQLVAGRLQELSGQQQPWVYWEAAADYTVCGPGSPDGMLLALLGADNATGDLNAPTSTVTPAMVIARNPDVIIKAADYTVVTSGYMASSSAMQQEHDVITERPGWNHISAVANDKVYVLSRTIVAGPQYIMGLLYTVKWLYPDLFLDINPIAIQTDMLQQFYGLPFKGSWAYPLLGDSSS